jgi:hypothetical protein
MEERMTEDKIKDGTEEECVDCAAHLSANPQLVAAASRAGQKLGWTAASTLNGYVATFHRNGHKDETAGRGGFPMVSDGGPLDLEAIKARAEAATPGPWNGTWHATAESSIEGSDGHTVAYVNSECADHPGRRDADGHFIAAARSDVPALVAEVERLTQFATSLGKALDARIGDVRRRDDEIESLRRQRAAERDVIEKAKAWGADYKSPYGATFESDQVLIAAVDALGDSQGDTDGQ